MFKSNLQTFNEKMILSTSKEDKKIYLWDESTGTVVYTYEDSNLKTYIPPNKLLVVGKDLYSEYVVAMQENKSLVSIWKTSASECAYKSSVGDERVSAMAVSGDGRLMFLGTDSGNLHMYELFTGNVITSKNLSAGGIHNIKPLLPNSGLITVLADEYLKLFLLEDILDEGQQVTSVCERPNYDAFKELAVSPDGNSLICFNSREKDKVSVFSLPQLDSTRTIFFQVFGRSTLMIECQVTSIFIATANCIFKIPGFDNSNRQNEQLKNETYNKGNLFPVIEVEAAITSFALTNKNIVLGTDDGKITIYNYSFKMIGSFFQHKGPITNILCINRPISQYGLNFNNRIEETVVRPLKRAHMKSDCIKIVKGDIQYADYAASFIDKCLKQNDFQHEKAPKLQEETYLSSKGQTDVENNLFLRKKLKSLYNFHYNY